MRVSIDIEQATRRFSRTSGEPVPKDSVKDHTQFRITISAVFSNEERAALEKLNLSDLIAEGMEYTQKSTGSFLTKGFMGGMVVQTEWPSKYGIGALLKGPIRVWRDTRDEANTVARLAKQRLADIKKHLSSADYPDKDTFDL